MGRVIGDASVAELLRNWNRLNEALMGLTEADVSKLLAAERDGRRRPNYLLRLHSRMSRLRHQRERRELLAGVGR